MAHRIEYRVEANWKLIFQNYSDSSIEEHAPSSLTGMRSTSLQSVPLSMVSSSTMSNTGAGFAQPFTTTVVVSPESLVSVAVVRTGVPVV